MWKTLAEMYGPRFVRDFGDTAPAVWQSTIRSLKDHELKKGLRRLTLAGSGSVPTLPQFVKACKAVGDDEGEARPAATFLPGPSYDDFHCFGQRALFAFLRRNHVCETTITRLIEVKNKLANDFRQMHREDEVTAEQMREALMRAFERVAT